MLDLVVENGLFFDGKGSVPEILNIGVSNGRVVCISKDFITEPARERVDATGCWVAPGFIDFHTHYDAEIEFDPSLSESLRHGVTTVFLGSCSLGAALGEPEDIADIFCRVEAVPREIMLPMLQKTKNWTSFKEYFQHLEDLPLGPNVTSFIGHSNVRMVAMGFERSVDPNVHPTEQELRRMEELVLEGLDEGLVGLSVQTLPWDKLDGDRCRSQPLPSYFATWKEYRRLTRILRDRGRIFQGVPNLVTKWNVALFLLESMGVFRKPLKTTVISVMDLVADRMIYWAVPMLATVFNRFFNADFRFQALPNLFDVWADGMDLVIFEEFGAGAEAMHLVDVGQRTTLLKDPEYRRRFRKQWDKMFSPRVYHRDFHHSEIRGCPDSSLVGRSFAKIAEERGVHQIDLFLDLVAEYGQKLRWHSVIANDRTKPLEHIVAHPSVLIGFSDAGAHLRNMAHYNFPLHMLRLVKEAKSRNEGFMTLEKAFYRLTGEIGDWFNIDAGTLEMGKRADIVVIDPNQLTEQIEAYEEAPIKGFGEFKRLVRRNPKTVRAVVVNGKIAVRLGEVLPQVGVSSGYGRVLRALS
ncbi:MAG: N-acyl-D-glutamate amidohydrolase [Proteobacteria bacterium]|nr:N-acyl-D-glutamate amidohydrolase [Pseudomonadota bacterium]